MGPAGPGAGEARTRGPVLDSEGDAVGRLFAVPDLLARLGLVLRRRFTRRGGAQEHNLIRLDLRAGALPIVPILPRSGPEPPTELPVC